jgi:hypothetical protein
LMRLLRRRIQDNKLLHLVWCFLRAGCLEGMSYRPTLAGVPQGGIVSCVLANVYGRLFGRKGTVSSMTP